MMKLIRVLITLFALFFISAELFPGYFVFSDHSYMEINEAHEKSEEQKGKEENSKHVDKLLGSKYGGRTSATSRLHKLIFNQHCFSQGTFSISPWQPPEAIS